MSIDTFLLTEYIGLTNEVSRTFLAPYSIPGEEALRYFQTFGSRFLARVHIGSRRAGAGRATAVSVERGRQETYDGLVALRADLERFTQGSYSNGGLASLVRAADAYVKDRNTLLEGNVHPDFSGQELFYRETGPSSKGFLGIGGRKPKSMYRLSDRGQAVIAAVIYYRNTDRLKSLAETSPELGRVFGQMSGILDNLDATIKKYAPYAPRG